MRRIVWMFLRHESEVQSPSAHCNKKVRQYFPLHFPPVLFNFHLPDCGGALTFAGIIFLSIRIFLALYAKMK